MNTENFRKILDKAGQKSDWISWLISDQGTAAHSTLHFLDTCIANLPAQKRAGVFKKLDTNEEQIEATINELVTHELLHRLKLKPDFEPLVDGLTPDLSFKILDKEFIADVYTIHSPLRAHEDFGDGTGKSWDKGKPGESRAHKIADELAKKADKYGKVKRPLAILVFLGDHHILSSYDVEVALFGMTVQEVELEDKFPIGVSRDLRSLGGIFLPYDDGKYRHSNLSAVISCD